MAPLQTTRRERITLSALLFLATLGVLLYSNSPQGSEKEPKQSPQNSDQALEE